VVPAPREALALHAPHCGRLARRSAARLCPASWFLHSSLLNASFGPHDARARAARTCRETRNAGKRETIMGRNFDYGRAHQRWACGLQSSNPRETDTPLPAPYPCGSFAVDNRETLLLHGVGTVHGVRVAFHVNGLLCFMGLGSAVLETARVPRENLPPYVRALGFPCPQCFRRNLDHRRAILHGPGRN
jgi:hypothetical protein